MEETIVGFETAKLAKEKGYSVGGTSEYTLYKKKYVYDGDPTHPESHKKGEVRYNDSWYHKNGETPFDKPNESYEVFEAPTQSLLQKWLRDEKGIDIVINTHSMDVNERGYSVYYGRFMNGEYWTGISFGNSDDDRFETYEQTLEFALVESLKLI